MRRVAQAVRMPLGNPLNPHLMRRHLRHLTRPVSSVQNGGFSFPSSTKLDSIMKLDTLQDKTREEITSLWTTYHADKLDCVTATLTESQSTLLMARGQDCPNFVFPVYRPEGMFTILSQFQERCVFFTYLEAFKSNPSRAPPYLTLSVYDELAPSKQMSLLRGDIAHELTRVEAETLLTHLLSWYLHDATKYQNDVVVFNKTPHAFEFDTYLQKFKQ